VIHPGGGEKRPSGVPPVEGGTDSIIVIGSGFGGAVAACRLKQAGFDVHVLERGRRYGPGDFPALPIDSVLLPDFGRWTWQHNQGLWDILDLEEIISVQAAGYGGGSLIYANVQLRPPDAVFDSRWPREYRNGDALRDYYPLGAYMLDAAPITEHAFFSEVVKADQLRQVAKDLKRDSAFFYPPIAVNRVEKESIGGRSQRACTGCGACCSGCPETAKNTLDYNYLAIAERWGAVVRTQCEVTDIESHGADGVPGEDGWVVDYVDHLAGEKRRIRGKHVFLCAGSVHSTRLLARARLKSVQSRVGVGYFPGGDALGVVYDTAHEQYPSFGPTITTTTVHWEATDPALYFLIQDGGYAQQLARLVGLLRAPAWVGRNRLSASTPRANVAPSQRTKAAREQRAAPNAIALYSLVDDVAKAVANGDFNGAIPAGLSASLPVVLSELTGPLLLAAIVDRTIDGSTRAFFQRFFLTRGLDPDGGLLRWLARVGRWIIRHIFGSDQDLAERALRAMLSGAGLPRDEWARQVIGYHAENANRRTMLLAMGRDAASGTLLYNRETDRLVADLDLFDLAPGYSNQERLMTDIATSLGGELRTNPAWAFLGRPITVHNQGGCPMSDDAALGVTNPDGKVHGVEGLFVLDGASLCTSVGVNPSATITALAERNVLRFIRSERQGGANWPQGDPSPGARQYAEHWAASRSWGKGWTVSPPVATEAPPQEFKSEALGIAFDETLQGYYSETERPLGSKDDRYLELETRGRPSHPVELSLTLAVPNLASFFEDKTHTMIAETGSVSIRLPAEADVGSYPLVKGWAQILTPRFKPYGVRPDTARAQAQLHFAKKYTTTVIPQTGVSAEMAQRFFYYLLWFEGSGKPWTLYGYKRVRDNPAVDAWRDTSTLFVSLFEGHLKQEDIHGQATCRGAGAVHTELTSFLFKQLHGLRVTGTSDPARIAWATTSFADFFFGSLLRIYIPGLGTAIGTLVGRPRDHVIAKSHHLPWRWGR
jgi:choline dehydrogenase-like flavoprotein